MGDKQRDGEDDGRNGKAEKSKRAFERLQPGRVAQRGAEYQRPEHDQKPERQQPYCGDEHVGDRFQPQQEPLSCLHHAVRAVEADPQALDTARGEKNGK
jgi:hypothetical protein